MSFLCHTALAPSSLHSSMITSPQPSWISLLFQVTKTERQVMKPLYDRYRLVKQILSRANTIPIIVSRAFFWGLFLWFQAEEKGITTLSHTTQSLRPTPSLPYSKTNWISDTPYSKVRQCWSRNFSVHTWTMSHISPCVVSPLSIGLLLLFHHLAFGYSLTSISLPIYSEL